MYFKISPSTIHQIEPFEVRNSKSFLGRGSPSPSPDPPPALSRASPSILRRFAPSIRASSGSASQLLKRGCALATRVQAWKRRLIHGYSKTGYKQSQSEINHDHFSPWNFMKTESSGNCKQAWQIIKLVTSQIRRQVEVGVPPFKIVLKI